jgi:hypothetical protein
MAEQTTLPTGGIDELERRVCGMILNERIEADKKLQAATPTPAPAPEVRHDPVSHSLVLSRTPTTDEEWKQTCQLVWPDAHQIYLYDPFWLATKKTSWKEFHRFISEREDRLLCAIASQQDTLSEAPEHRISIQMLVRKGPGGKPVQDFCETFAVGNTGQYSLVVGALDDDPKAFFLWKLRIDDPAQVQCNLMRTVAPSVPSAKNTTDLHQKLDEKLACDISMVSPLWEMVEASLLPGAPCLGAVSREIGVNVAAIVCEGKPNRVHLFDISETEYLNNRRSIELPCERPSTISISSTHIAAMYLNGQVPHVQTRTLLPELPALEEPKWHIYVPQASEEVDKDGKLDLWRMTLMYHHRAVPRVVCIGTTKGAVLAVDCNTGMQAGEPYYAMNPTQYAKLVKHLASKSKDPDSVLQEMRSPEQEVMFINATQSDKGEPRMLICYDHALAFSDGNDETQTLMRSLGKRPMAYVGDHTPPMCAEVYGGMLAVFNVMTCGVELGYLPTFAPRVSFPNSDVTKEMILQRHPYPALTLFSERIVILYPNGMVGFVELMTEENKKEYLEAVQELLVTGKNKIKPEKEFPPA